MAIPLYGCTAHGGKIIALDDEAVVRDLAADDGSGGVAFTPYLVSAPIDGGQAGGYARLRRVVQDVEHDGAVTLSVTPVRDGQETGQTIVRPLDAGDHPVITLPFAAGATRFQVRVELADFDAAAELGKAELWIVPRRTTR